MSKKKFDHEKLDHLESFLEDFQNYVDPLKGQRNWDEIWQNATEEQKLFISVFQLEGSIYGRLFYLNRQLKEKHGHELRVYIRHYSIQLPKLKLFPVYKLSIQKFCSHFPFRKLDAFYKKTNKALSKKSNLLPEEKKLRKVIQVDWINLFSTLEDHVYLKVLVKSLEFYNPIWFQKIKTHIEDYPNSLHNYFIAKTGVLDKISSLQSNTSGNNSFIFKKTKAEWKKLYKSSTKNFNKAFKKGKELAFTESFTVSEFNSSLKAVEIALEEFQRIDFFHENLKQTLQFIHVRNNQETTKLLFLHDILQIVIPNRFTSDKIFDLEMGPMYNHKGNLDLAIKRKKISEVRQALGIPVNS